MRSLRLLLFAAALGLSPAAWAQSPTYGLGKAPTAEEVRAIDITISPNGSNLPAGQGSAKEGTPLFAQKCAACHGAAGSGGPAPMLIKPPSGTKVSTPCLNPCINEGNVMALHSPYATTLWDYINRGMPYKQEGTLKPDEVYALTAFILFKNGVIQEDTILDAQSLPQVKMPNRDGYALPEWKHGMPRPFPNKP